MEAKKLALAIAEIALDKQAESLEIINVEGKVDYATYIVICSGRSERHVESLTLAVDMELKKQSIYPLGVEGKEAKQWILVDYDDVIFHVFHDQKRGFYDLDSLWIDAERIPLRRASSAN